MKFLKAAMWTVFYALRGVLAITLIFAICAGVVWAFLTHPWTFVLFAVGIFLFCGYSDYKDSYRGQS